MELVNGRSFQARVAPWMQECFGAAVAPAHMLVDYVFGRPTGEPSQEVGGVMVTLAALCLAAGMDMHDAGNVELARVWTCIVKIRAKQAKKPHCSPLPGALAPGEEQ